MNNNSSVKVTFTDVLRDIIGWSGYSDNQFSVQVGFSHPDRVYRALKPGGVKLGLDSLEAILNRFPELNGDRFIRRSGPILLSELCKEKQVMKIEQIIKPSLENENHYRTLSEERLRTIERQEKEIDFLRKLIDK